MSSFYSILIAIVAIIMLSVITAVFYLKQPLFGQNPSGVHLEKIQQSANYRDGKFRNLIEKPVMAEGYGVFSEIYQMYFKRVANREPKDVIPSIKTDLKNLNPNRNVIVWFGHSTVFLQLNGKTFLLDPVMSGKASPLPWGIKAYKGTDIYTVDDLPNIDYVLISHDHYDHLDYETMLKLKEKVSYVVSGLGVGAHLQAWGYREDKLIERDWGQVVNLEDGVKIYLETAHHDSGRALKGAQNLWASYVIESGDKKIFYSGDGGYGEHFARIGQKFGGFDWAIMENGQYDLAWQSIHCLPDQVAKATVDLQAKNMLPVHHSKFTLAKHAWSEPIEKIYEYSQGKVYRLATPMIGEEVNLDDQQQQFTQWWKNVL